MYTLYKKDVCHFELECAYVEHTADGESRRRRCCTFEDTLKQLTVNHLPGQEIYCFYTTRRFITEVTKRDIKLPSL
jgi:hypothetical protein